ncbi:MAG TPA: hypothetical protein VIM58_04340, partial [Candidatus Methylacidiphilales bacterium]
FAFVDAAALDLAFLGDPPAENSPDAKAEFGTLLYLQDGRTPEAVARIAAEREMAPEVFAGAVGPWFNAAALPKTAALLAAVKADTERAADRAKRTWARTPPAKADRRVHPAAPLPPGSSYPCSDAAVGTVWGFVLGELMPDKRQGLFVRAAEIGDDQVLAGLRFPSDVVAGRKLGVEITRQLLESPAFQDALKEAKAELDAAPKTVAALPSPTVPAAK